MKVEQTTRAGVAGMIEAARQEGFRVRDLPGVAYFTVRGMGFATVRLDEIRGRLVMDYVWVTPPFRRCGAGTALVAACEDYARRDGAPALYAATRLEIRGILKARGWVETGGHENKLPVFALDLEVNDA